MVNSFFMPIITRLYCQMTEEPQKIRMENQTIEHIEEAQIATHQDDIEELHRELEARFNIIIEIIAKDAKIEDYLQQINVTAKELTAGYEKIVESCRALKAKIGKNHVIEHSVRTTFSFLLEFIKTKNIDDLDSKGKTVWFLEIQTKLACSLQFLHSFKQHEDITNSPPTAYPEVWARIRTEKLKDEKSVKKVKKDFKSMKKMLHVTTAAMLNEEEHDFSLIKKCTFGLSFPRYLIMNDSGKLRSFIFYRTPTLDMAQKIWNIPELGATKELTKILYEGVKTNRKIYIPPNASFAKKINIFTEDNTAITVRILYTQKLRYFHQASSVGCCSSGEDQVNFIDTVLLHMHGGGFVALSSRSMQNYTRRWANQLNIPILSIDYRMPPDNPFPAAPNDCLQVYRFVVEHIHQYMNIRPKNIYLAGDSAGGNLVFSLTGLILKNKLPPPRALYAAYPAADIRIMFSPSRLYSITDPLLWPSMLLLCLDSYLKGNLKMAEDPLASPILLTEQYVNGTPDDKRFPLNWPKTLITVGTRDPLMDDSLMLMQKMVQSKIDCSCILYEQLSHGYLSIQMFVKQCQKTINQSLQHLSKLIEETRTK